MNAPADTRAVVLAVDGGGTTARAVLLTPAGRCVGYGSAGSGNATSVGVDAAAESIATASRHAAEQAGIDLASVAVAVAALAGADQRADHLATAVAACGGPADVEVAADLLAMYLSGTVVADGAVLLAGTGAIAGRVVGHELVRVVDGLGWLLGDEGSAFAIGRAVARAVGAMLDGRRPPTSLAALVLDRLGSDEVRGGRFRADPLRRLLADVYADRPVSVARFAPLALTAAADGDAAAVEIVEEAIAALANTLRATLGDAEAVSGPLVLGGGVLAANPSIGDELATRAAADGHDLEVIRVSDGVVGAAQLALRAAGHPVDPTVFATIQDTLPTLRQ